jgi:hypothetical protein
MVHHISDNCAPVVKEVGVVVNIQFVETVIQDEVDIIIPVSRWGDVLPACIDRECGWPLFLSEKGESQ